MMNYEEFLLSARDALQDKMPEMAVKIEPVDKLQGGSYLGIAIRPRETSISAVLNVRPFYEQYQLDESKEAALLDEIVEKAGQEIARIPSFRVEDLTSYEKLKERLVMQMVPVEKNREMLEKIPHKIIGDMAVVYRIEIGRDDRQRSSALIRNEHLGKYGISLEELHQDAVRSQMTVDPPTLRNMAEVLGFLGYSEESSLWIATTQGGIYGAAACQIPGFMEECTEKLGKEFYVLPSSVHELIFLPDDGKVDRNALENMVREINRTEVKEEDVLSNQVYHYDSKTRVFELAGDYESRTKEQERPEESREEEQTELSGRDEEESSPEKNRMSVLLVEPGRYPRPVEMGTELEDLQKAVGGFIQVIYPFEEEVGLIMNEEGKLEGLPLNRALYDEDGEMYDVIAGSFLVAGLTEEGFGSLTPEQMEKYEDLYHQPETFVQMGRKLMAVPIPDEEVARTGARDAGEKDVMKKILRPVEAR